MSSLLGVTVSRGTFFSVREIFNHSFWPTDILPLPDLAVLDECGVIDFFPDSNNEDTYSVNFVVVDELAIYLEQVGIEVAFFAGHQGFSTINLELKLVPNPVVRFNTDTSIRFSPNFLRPLDNPNPEDTTTSLSSTSSWAQVLFNTEIEISVDGDFQFDPVGDVRLNRSYIGDTQISIEATGIDIAIWNEPAYVGLKFVKLHLPDDIQGAPDLTLEDAVIDGAGFSGSFSAEWSLQLTSDRRDFAQGANVGTLFSEDIKFGFKEISIRFDNNAPTEFRVIGAIKMPILDSVIEAELSFGEDGEILVGLRGLGDDGLLTLTKDELFELQVDAIEFSRTAEETGLTVSGEFELLMDSVKDIIPKFGVQGFTVFKPSEGSWDFRFQDVSIEINKSIEIFEVVRADIREVLWGQDGSDKRLVLSGGVQILEGVDAGGWFENLGVSFSVDPLEVKDISVDGIGLLVVVPDSFEFMGVAVRKEEGGTSYIEGGISLTLIPLGMGLSAFFKVGRNPHCRFAFLSANFCLPGPGIQLAALPLYIRCLGGLIGLNTTPDADTIYDYFPLAQRQPQGLMYPSKWRDQCDMFAIGFGVTIATANPKLFTLEALFAFVVPEYLLAIQGLAWVLMKPSIGKEPPFFSLMAIDFDDMMALFNISVKFDFINGVLSVDGMMEAYYGPDQSNPSRTTFYFALGKKQPFFPIDNPVKAKIFQLFTASIFLYMGKKGFAIGVSIGLPEKKYDFSVASVAFGALIAGYLELGWSPAYVIGSHTLEGKVEFRIAKKGFAIWLHAHVLGMAADLLIDALLKFGVKLNLGFFKFKFKAEIPFHWEKRIAPPIPELLKEINLQHPISGETSSPLILNSSATNPDLNIIPEVEPSEPALEFNFAMDDRTGFPFGQDVSSYQPHRSGDYTFHSELPEGTPGSRGIEMYRMKIDDYPDGDWVRFNDGPNVVDDTNLNDDEKPVLYGAWQATQSPDGTPFRTHLHLFARTPFDYNRHNWLNAARAEFVYTNQHTLPINGTQISVQIGSTESKEAISDASRSILSDDFKPAIEVPNLDAQVKDFIDLRVINKPLPLGSVQYIANDQPGYPRTNMVGTSRTCHNFLTKEPKFYKSSELIYLDGDESPPETFENWETSSDVIMGGRGNFLPTTRTRFLLELGICEVIEDDTLPIPLRYLKIHNKEGMQETDGERVIGELTSGVIKISLRYKVKQLEIHYKGTHTIRNKEGVFRVPSLQFRSAYSNPFSSARFWQFTNPVQPSPNVDTSEPGKIVITIAEDTSPFNEIAFDVLGEAQIFSLCYEIDSTEELAEKERQINEIIDILAPMNGDGSGPDEPIPDDDSNGRLFPSGPMLLSDHPTWNFLGPIVPGYVYRLDVRTSNRMTGGGSGGTREQTYSAYWQVPRPPADLAPYVLTACPKDTGFPHYRITEYFLRSSRNYLHKLMGEENHKLTWEVQRENVPISILPFKEISHDEFIPDPETGLPSFLLNTDPERKGWGWGKANNHLLAREEEIWLKSYNQALPAFAQVSNEMIIPDDMMWIYPVNAIVLRDDFRWDQDGDNSIGISPHFQLPIIEGSPVGGEWLVENSLLNHNPGELANLEPSNTITISESFLITMQPIEVPYLLSVWLQPQTTNNGYVGFILAANQSLSRYLKIILDPHSQRVRLIRKDETLDPADQIRTLIDRPIGLSHGRWSRLFIRLTPVSGQLAVTLEYAGQIIFSEVSDLPSNLPSDQQFVGLLASADYDGKFDNFEVLSTERLKELPIPGATHHLALKYNDQEHPMEMYKAQFLASQYLDLFDHLNAWDRNVWVSKGNATDDDNVIISSVTAWESENFRLLTELGNLANDEQQYTAKLRTLEDLDATKKRLREARFGLDEQFENVASNLGFDLAARPVQFEFILAKNGKGLLIQSAEPLDWTRLSAGSITKGVDSFEGNEQNGSIRTQLLYSSDLTRAILLLRPDDFSIQVFEDGHTYLWTLGQYINLPAHLDWLEGWVDHRKEMHTLTLEIPGTDT